MKGRRFVLALGAALLTGGIAVPVSAQTTKIARVGILSGASLSTPANAARFHEAFVEILVQARLGGRTQSHHRGALHRGPPRIVRPGCR